MKRIQPGRVEGSVAAPASKSVMQRAVAIATLTEGESAIRHPSSCDDARAALGVARALGSRVEIEPDRVRIVRGAAPGDDVLACGEAGLCLRMFAAVAACRDRPLTLTGDAPLLRRPLPGIEEPLRALGAEVETTGGFPPLRVQGPLRGGTAVIEGAESSQFLTGLLIALPTCPADSELIVRNPKSRPYVAMTVAMVRAAGAKLEHDEGFTRFRIPGGQRYAAREMTVEGDWSGAAALLVAGALAGRIQVRDLDPRSTQADRALLVALERAGAEVAVSDDAATVTHRPPRAFDFDATDCPDLFPPLVALAVHAAGVTTLTGASRLRHKESDRAAVLRDEFAKLGARIEVDGDVMRIAGGPLGGGRVQAHHDHRIAMALAVAALAAEGAVEIDGWECVSKSYPEFFDDLAALRRQE